MSDSFVARFPDARPLYFRANVLWTQHKYDSVAIALDQLDRAAKDVTDRAYAKLLRASLDRLHGRLRDAHRFESEGFGIMHTGGDKGALLRAGLNEATDVAFLLGDRARALRMVDTLLRRQRLDTMTGFVRREYLALVTAYAFAGEPVSARRAMQEWDAKRASFRQSLDANVLESMAGLVDLASGRYREAALELRHSAAQGCVRCVRAAEGMAWEKAGDADSAITTYERYLDTPELLWEESDSFYLPTVYQHLATLYEARNDRERSVQHYRTFIALWSTADPELQPAVRAAKQRVEALTRGTDTRR